MNLLSVEKLSKRYGEKVLFSGITFGISQGQKVGLIARNGSGKTSLLKIISGKDVADSGNVVWRKETTVSYLEQEEEFKEGTCIEDFIFNINNPQLDIIKAYYQAVEANDETALGELYMKLDELNAWETENRVNEILSRLNLYEIRKQDVSSLSGGQQKRLSLAKVLIENADFIILDEPTNHLDLQMVMWLEDYLIRSKQTIFMVTHDRYFLDNVCDEIQELDNGEMYKYKGNYSYYLEKRAERKMIEMANVDKAQNLMRKELDWVRRMPKARTTKSKSRLDAFADLKEKAKRKTEEKAPEIEVKMSRLGSKIIEMHKVSKGFSGKKILYQFSYVFKRNERISITGPNGSGKSTFINLITGEIQPDTGKIVQGETVVFGHYKQEGIKLSEEKRVIELIKDIAEVIPLAGGKTLLPSQLLERFNFPSHQHYTYVSKLSGGEKRRLYLLTVLMKNPNFLILDEPTNDLDIFTLQALEEYLDNYDGCLVVISHDRFFMDRLCDHLFVFKGDGEIKDFPGNYTQFREYEKEQEQLKKDKTEATNFSPKNNEPKITKTDEKRKLSYNEKKEYEILEKEIPLLEAKRNKLNQAFTEEGITSKQIKSITEELISLQEELSKKTERWFELAEYI
ncbi:MAG: ABC-F family ATP-binding cassette domain-containing protein [Flavobacteriales bacterium]